MSVDLVAALAAGLVGGALMLVLQLAASSRVPAFDVLLMWASLLALEGQRAVGLVVHLAVSAAIAVLYALGFTLSGAADNGWAWGLVGGVIHWIAAGAFIGIVRGADTSRLRAPGPFGMRLGAPVAVGFLAGHLAFGLTVGLIYFALRSTGGGLLAAP